jgi:DNA replication and repair protein RecF
MTYIHTLALSHFRSYFSLSMENITARHIILCGANGAGKTNILEALSLLSPGRGLRQAKLSDMRHKHHPVSSPWALSAGLLSHYGVVQIGSAQNEAHDKRRIHVNGQAIKSQAELGEWLSCLWLTPQMDRLFIDDKSQRRRFFDRLVYTFDPAHMGRLTRYENALRQRMKLLKYGANEERWLNALEEQIAETGIALCAARETFCAKLQSAYHSATQEERDNFPKAALSIEGVIEDLFHANTALETEEHLKRILKQNRLSDAESAMTLVGPHRSDFVITYHDKQMPAAQSSTGEQKALLIGIILAHARLLKEEHAHAPLLLLDEIVAHLDPSRRKILANILQFYTSQVWMTGTDPALFCDFRDRASLYEVKNSTVYPSVFLARDLAER